MASKRLLRQLDNGSELCVGDSYPECAALATRYVIRHRNWYRQRARSVRRMFRIFGVGVILLSASLPVVAAIDFSDSQLVITVISVLVAALTALRTFFQWDGQWRILKAADWKLTALIGSWEADVCALDTGEPAKAKVAAMQRTRMLLDDADKVIDSEATSFFTAVSWPETGGRSSAAEPQGAQPAANAAPAGAPPDTPVQAAAGNGVSRKWPLIRRAAQDKP